MGLHRKNPLILIIVATVVLSLTMSTMGSAMATTKTSRAAMSPFNLLVVKLKEATSRLARLLAGRQVVGAAPKVAAKAAIKGDVGEPEFKPTPTPPLPEGAPRMPVSASGPFAAEVSEAGRKVFGANQTVAVGYSQGTYYLVQDGKTVATSGRPIKLVPAAEGSIISLPEFQDMNWNNTVNLNTFRGNIEIAYSGKSNRLWAVNEVTIEDYLRGIAEAAHDAPEEHT